MESPEKIAREALEQICKQGYLDCRKSPPCHSMEDLKKVQDILEGAVIRAMYHMREACTQRIMEGIPRLPDEMPDFMKSQAQQAMKMLAEAIQSVHVPISSALLPYRTAKAPPQGSFGTFEKVDSHFECHWC